MPTSKVVKNQPPTDIHCDIYHTNPESGEKQIEFDAQTVRFFRHSQVKLSENHYSETASTYKELSQIGNTILMDFSKSTSAAVIRPVFPNHPEIHTLDHYRYDPKLQWNTQASPYYTHLILVRNKDQEIYYDDQIPFTDPNLPLSYKRQHYATRVLKKLRIDELGEKHLTALRLLPNAQLGLEIIPYQEDVSFQCQGTENIPETSPTLRLVPEQQSLFIPEDQLDVEIPRARDHNIAEILRQSDLESLIIESAQEKVDRILNAEKQLRYERNVMEEEIPHGKYVDTPLGPVWQLHTEWVWVSAEESKRAEIAHEEFLAKKADLIQAAKQGIDDALDKIEQNYTTKPFFKRS